MRTSIPHFFRIPVLVIVLVLYAPHSGFGQVADTLDWHRYFPTQVGNQWQYTLGDGFVRERVLGDTVIQENTYAIRLQEFGDATGVLSTKRTYERPIEVGAYIAEARVRPGDSLFTDQWRGDVCHVNAPFGSQLDCPEVQASGIVGGEYSHEVLVGSQIVLAPAYKTFEMGTGSAYALAADIGRLSWGADSGPSAILQYAYVDGVAYGTPIVSTAVEISTPGDRSDCFELFPVPAADVAWLQIPNTHGRTWSVRIIDVTGREIYRTTWHSPSTTITHHIPVTTLPAGIYIVSVVSNRGPCGSRTFPIVR